MGLFNMNYNRPGPGVNKDEPKKKAFFRFFELFFRKFWKLIQLNLLFCIPLVVIGILLYFVSKVTSNSFLVNIPLVLIFPFIAGLAMVTRNYVREEHAFVLSDFTEAIQKNWKTFLINGVVFYAVYAIMNVAVTYYSHMSNSNSIFVIPMALCIALSALFIFAQYYIPVMIITFDLKLKDIYKNALIFAILGLWRNLLITVILAVLGFVIFVLMQLSPLTIIIGIILIIFILFSFIMFLVNFAVYPLIDKNMIQPYLKNQASETDGDSDNSPDFHD